MASQVQIPVETFCVHSYPWKKHESISSTPRLQIKKQISLEEQHCTENNGVISCSFLFKQKISCLSQEKSWHYAIYRCYRNERYGDTALKEKR